jgi:penicillin-binding protein 2
MPIQFDPERYQPPKGGLLLLQVCMAVLFFLLATRLWYLQILRGDDFERRATANHTRMERIYALRGLIRDQNGTFLAENRPGFDLAIVREECLDVPSTLAQISEWSNIPLDQILAKYTKNTYSPATNPRGVKSFEPLILLPDMSFDLLAKIESELYNWPGLTIVTRAKRAYPQADLLTHILGYVAEADQEELNKDEKLQLGDSVGKQGLELVLEQVLRGRPGYDKVEKDAHGRSLHRSLETAPESGENITLTIDLSIQQAAWDALGEQAGSVVVLDAHSGRIIAMVSKPSYNNNLFVRGISSKDWRQILNNPRHPLQNRSIQSMYPPGSVWKLVMAGLLLENNVSPKETVFCSGETSLGNSIFRCWRRGGHGHVNMEKALVESCDVYFYHMGDRMGVDRIAAFASACGFGVPTTIDLPSEKGGLVPTSAWKLRRFNEPWQRGETFNISIGQGFMLVTPVQIASFIGALTNGGQILKPLLLADEHPIVRGHLPMTDANREFLVENMRLTVAAERGTARVVRRNDAIMGGKTGTAQVVKLRMIGERRARLDETPYEQRDHAWIATWGMKNGRTIVVVVMVEHGGGGSSVAGPVAKKVYDVLFKEGS